MFIQTVKVARPDLPGGFLIMNESDFNPETMELFDDTPKPDTDDKPLPDSLYLGKKKRVKHA